MLVGQYIGLVNGVRGFDGQSVPTLPLASFASASRIFPLHFQSLWLTYVFWTVSVRFRFRFSFPFLSFTDIKT